MTTADIQVSEPAPYESYMQRLADGDIAFQRCATCNEAFFFPRVLCPSCGAVELRWQASSGRGVVYSTTAVPQRDGESYALCLVDLEEGIRMMSNVIGVRADEVRIGDRVIGRVESAEGNGQPRVVFEIAAL